MLTFANLWIAFVSSSSSYDVELWLWTVQSWLFEAFQNVNKLIDEVGIAGCIDNYEVTLATRPVT